MERTQHTDDLIDLGVASHETKGSDEGGIEPGALKTVTGLADD